MVSPTSTQKLGYVGTRVRVRPSWDRGSVTRPPRPGRHICHNGVRARRVPESVLHRRSTSPNLRPPPFVGDPCRPPTPGPGPDGPIRRRQKERRDRRRERAFGVDHTVMVDAGYESGRVSSRSGPLGRVGPSSRWSFNKRPPGLSGSVASLTLLQWETPHTLKTSRSRRISETI